MARKKKTKPLGLRDASLVPATRDIDDGGLLQRVELIDSGAPIGTYEVDKLAIDWLRLGRKLESQEEISAVRDIRFAADWAGSQSANMAREILGEPERYDQCKRLFDQLDMVRRMIGAVAAIEPAEVARVIADDQEVADQGDSDIGVELYNEKILIAEDDTVALQRGAAEFKNAIDRYLSGYKLPSKVPDCTEPWTTWFIKFSGLTWRGVTGGFLKVEDAPDFRRFLVAAWTDLRFPDPLDRDGNPKPLEDHFRDRLAKSNIFESYP